MGEPRAFCIITKMDEPGDWSIWIGRSAGEAKTLLVTKLADSYRGATYAWVVSCRRAPEFDRFAVYGLGCCAWHQRYESWSLATPAPSLRVV